MCGRVKRILPFNSACIYVPLKYRGKKQSCDLAPTKKVKAHSDFPQRFRARQENTSLLLPRL